MTEQNIFEIFTQSPQKLFWQHLKENQTYTLTLILPFHSKTITYAKGYYSRLAVTAEDTITLNGIDIGTGEMLILDFPSKTLLNALNNTNQTFRTQVEKNNNLYIKFTKKNRQRITIQEIQKTQCTQEQETFAMKVYNGTWEFMHLQCINTPYKTEVKKE